MIVCQCWTPAVYLVVPQNCFYNKLYSMRSITLYAGWTLRSLNNHRVKKYPSPFSGEQTHRNYVFKFIKEWTRKQAYCKQFSTMIFLPGNNKQFRFCGHIPEGIVLSPPCTMKGGKGPVLSQTWRCLINQLYL